MLGCHVIVSQYNIKLTRYSVKITCYSGTVKPVSGMVAIRFHAKGLNQNHHCVLWLSFSDRVLQAHVGDVAADAGVLSVLALL